jgi:hypothetical protein
MKNFWLRCPSLPCLGEIKINTLLENYQMPTNTESLNRELFRLLSKYKPKPLDAEGKVTPIPDEADIFKFEFTKDGKDYGTVYVTLDEDRVLTVYFGDDVANSPDAKTPKLDYNDTWSGLLDQLSAWRMTKGLKGFNTQNKDRVGDDMARRNHMRNKDKIAEGYYATGKKSSYSDAVPSVKIVIEHSRVIEEGEQRYRNINRIFLENQAGERYLLDTKKPGIARVYARHIAEGGKVNDDRWSHIGSLCEEYQKMAGFVRATRNGQFNESAQSLVNEGIAHYQSLRESLSRMTGKRGYNVYFENWTPALMEDGTEENNLNELFVQETLDPRIESVMPILNRIHKKVAESVVDKEMNKLAEWADSLVEEESLTSNNPVGIPESETSTHKGGAVSSKNGVTQHKSGPGVYGGYDANRHPDSPEEKHVGSRGAKTGHRTDKVVKHKEVDESALQAYLGDKKYGEKGMNALRAAGRKHASKTKMQNIRAKFSHKEKEVDEQAPGWARHLGGAALGAATGAGGAFAGAPLGPLGMAAGGALAGANGYDLGMKGVDAVWDKFSGKKPDAPLLHQTKDAFGREQTAAGNDVEEGKTIASGLNDWQKKALNHDTYEKYVSHCNRYDYPHMDKRAWQRYKNAFDNMGTQGVAEGHQVVPGIDREKYTERPGLEGPFSTKSGKVVYYDKQEGKYYDPGTDFYISHDDYQAMNEQGMTEMAGIEETHPAVRQLRNKLGQVAKQNPGSGLGRHYDNIKNGMTYKSLVNKGMVDQNGKINIPGFKDEDEEGVTEGTGSSIERILAAHPEAVENFKQGGDLDYDLESDLWEYYYNNGEIRNYDADASEFISQRLADELGLSEGLDADQKRVGQLGPTEKVKNNNIGKLVGANENFINTVDQAVVSEEDEMAESILSAIKKVGKKVIDTVAPGDEELLKQLDKDVHGGKVPNRYNSDSESAKKYPADSWKAKVDESSDELARILTIMNHRR